MLLAPIHNSEKMAIVAKIKFDKIFLKQIIKLKK